MRALKRQYTALEAASFVIRRREEWLNFPVV
jgi:hypothetical protein